MAPGGLSAAGSATGAGLRDRVTAHLAQRILSRTYREGEAIPTEGELTTELNVSRTVLREAVRTLAAKGLLETRQKAGTLVPKRERWHLLDPDVLAWMGTVPPDASFVRDLTEARRVIEPAAAELAARNSSGYDLSLIEAAYAEMRASAADDMDASIEADVRFHRALLRASGNIIFTNLGDAVAAALRSAFRMTTTASENYARTLDAHGEVIDAIRLRDAPLARARVEALIDIASADLSHIARTR